MALIDDDDDIKVEAGGQKMKVDNDIEDEYDAREAANANAAGHLPTISSADGKEAATTKSKNGGAAGKGLFKIAPAQNAVIDRASASS